MILLDYSSNTRKCTNEIYSTKMASAEQVSEVADNHDERETTKAAAEPAVTGTPKPVSDDEDSEWEDLDGIT